MRPALRRWFPLALTSRELPTGHIVTAECLAVVTSWLTAALPAASLSNLHHS